MMYRTGLAAGLACGLCAGGMAVAEVTGGELELTHSRFSDGIDLTGGDEASSRTSLETRAEIALDPAFALQLDAAMDRMGGTEDWAAGVGAHGLYRFSGTGAVGVFAGYDSADAIEAGFFGAEARGDIRGVAVQGFVMGADAEAGSGTVYGVSGSTPVGLRGVVGASLALGEIGDADLSRAAVDGTYELTSQFKLTGEIGYADAGAAGASEGDLFIGIGGRVDFGGNRGAPFDRRGLVTLIPGL